ncbi:MAG TPA: tripartite tricarboxylate transporter permease [Hyphomicrobiales bacterium]|nr:tripartite tricarboxylate transporter permease [Hyphomicrobiales bacterium]
MQTLDNMLLGFSQALSFDALLYCLVGVSLGTFVGVLPGIGALTTISLCLPLTFHLDPLLGLIMLAGIFYGAQYGSSTASILLNVPGSAPSAVTCLDGYPMARQGKAGIALFLTTVASFIGGSFAILLLMGFAPVLADIAIGFSAADYFSIMLLALTAASTLGVGSPLKGLCMVVLGLVLGLVGTDISSGVFRFTFGMPALADGISLVALAMGLFGVAEILANVTSGQLPVLENTRVTLRSMLPSRQELREFKGSCARGSLIGSLVGMLPGTGPTIAASFMAYAMEKKLTKHPERFGKGAVEGVTAPEAANNASVQAAFIPTLTLGVPGDAIMAVMIGGLLIHGITPGPQLITENAALFWGVVASFWVGNILLLLLNLPFIGVWVRLLSIPYRVLFPAVLLLICIGVYSVNNNVVDVWLTLGFGLFGFWFNRHGYPSAPLLLGFVLGPLIEENFRRALLLSGGSLTPFVERPVSAVFLLLTALVLGLAAWQRLRRGTATMTPLPATEDNP